MAERPSRITPASVPGQQTDNQKQTRVESLSVTDDTKTQARAGSSTYENIDEMTSTKKIGSQAYENISVVPNRSTQENVLEPRKDKHTLQTHFSDPILGATGNTLGEDIDSDSALKPRSVTVLPTVRFPISKKEDCRQCSELLELLSLWELGVSGLARNYSRILAQLNKAKDAVVCLESKMKERAGVEGMAQSLLTSGVLKSSNKRHTVMAEGLNSEGTCTLASQMYPRAEGTSMSSDQVLPSDYVKYLGELNTYLGAAVDLCQQLAAACFKSDRILDSQSLTQAAQRLKTKPPIKRHSSQPSGQAPSTPPLSPFRPSLSSISESTPTSTFKRVQGVGCQSSASQVKLTNGSVPNDSEHEEVENGKKTCQEESISDLSTQLQSSEVDNTPFRSHMMSLIEAGAGRSIAPSFILLDSTDCHNAEDMSRAASNGTFSTRSRDSVLSSTSTFSDKDVKQVMSKIASLEEERLKLLETIDSLQEDNQLVRLSLYETLSDLENKDLQLTLAMQDLTIATDEIKRATEMRAEVAQLGNERGALLERLSNLEDESAAVKVSLIQLLQEKSATNKTLALENWRLTQRMRQLATVPSVGNSSPTTTVRRNSSAEADNVSLSSVATGSEVDAGLQETYIGLDDAGCYVHKQGFLVKQGGKVKNWKKRLFVLDSDGLSYFKTEQPIQKVNLSKIEKVQICHGRTPYPNMFEVHTRERIFYLSAITHDEMQSWVGMLQTLKQYHQRRQPRERNTLKAPPPLTGGDSSDEAQASPTLVKREITPKSPLDTRVSLPPQLFQHQKENGESSFTMEEYSRSVPAAVAGFTETDEETLTAGSLDLAVKSPMSHT